ncbi:hypothetical protein Glove_13g245 [Diversispora epigaea]|uniref:Uncharacterized protein n=1 Tax=Diversispora epigaea TaxID=1348612 RepID=A0A397JMC7_9GLOM|nr:hypothetical protein Glove_13g245 [Diversispora epigaea]
MVDIEETWDGEEDYTKHNLSQKIYTPQQFRCDGKNELLRINDNVSNNVSGSFSFVDTDAGPIKRSQRIRKRDRDIGNTTVK